MEAATAAGVGSWLRGIGLPQLVETFEQAQYDDLEIVKELKSEDLLELGITEAGVRKKLLVHASRLGSGGGEQTPYSPKASYVQWLPQAWHSDIKIMNDGLHGHMHMPTYCVEFIDTPQFQRLRDLKQLGTSYYVFPGASHNRFEHCLGTSHLAGQLVERFAKLQPELDITERDIRVVRLAGLCHDLGHGAFSHAFEDWVRARTGNAAWTHEDMSQRMVEYLIDDNHLDYSRRDVQFLLSLISGERPGSSAEKGFLYEIVSNKRNSIDVDKFDYIARDSKHVGMQSGFDHERLISLSRVINDEICFYEKADFQVYELFRTRYSLFKQVYSHRVSKGIEYMVGDAMTLADDYLGISQSVSDIRQYSLLTDSILRTIQCSTAPELAEARDIVRMIGRRDVYKCVGEFIVPQSQCPHFPTKVYPSDIITCQPSGDHDLQESDIIVHNFKINYAMADKNPVDHVHFFAKAEPEVSFTIPREQVSMLLPEVFSEQYVRVYCRRKEKAHQAHLAFQSYLRQFGCSVALRSPFRATKPTSTSPRTSADSTTPSARNLFGGAHDQ
jgi:HD superfamily phosphohydrolase